MRILRMAAFAIAASLSLAAAPVAWSHGGQMGGGHIGGGHIGGGHGHMAGGTAHFNGVDRHGGFHHGVAGHRFHGLGPAFIVAGIWYPWYAYPYPVYSGTAYYCQSAGLYYPQVTACPEGWVVVAPPAMLP